jgi:hypothetical protein
MREGAKRMSFFRPLFSKPPLTIPKTKRSAKRTDVLRMGWHMPSGYKRCRFKNVLPEPLFRYFSKARALFSSAKAK